MCRAVAAKLTASLAAVHDNKALFDIGLCRYRLHLSAARVGAIPWIYVHVQAPKAEGTVVARGIPKGRDLPAAMRTDKGAVVF